MRVFLGLLVFLLVDHFHPLGQLNRLVSADVTRRQQKELKGLGSGTNGQSKKSSQQKHHPIIDDYDDYKDEEYDDEDYDNEKKLAKKIKDGDDLSKWDAKCPPEIEGRCHCGHRTDPRDKSSVKYVVNCTNAGFTSAEFLQFIPDETELLIVRLNKIRELPTNVFGRTRSHKNLKEIDLSDNGIEEIKGKAFHHVAFVETLILNWNKISQETLFAHTRLFSNFVNLKFLHLSGAFEPNNRLMEDLLAVFKDSNLTKLQKLHLERNNIERIPLPKQFCDLTSLMDLHLGQNRLSDLDLNTEAECLPHLRFIDLSYNNIKSVRKDSALFDIMRRLNGQSEPISVDLYENPFNCDCTLNTYLEWLHNISRTDPDQIRHRESLRCKTGLPESNVNLLLHAVNQTTCPLLYPSSNRVINTLSWTLFSLIISASVLLLTAFYYYKFGAPAWILACMNGSVQSPLLMTPQGVKYTSIEKEEVAEVAHV